jgi:DNA modification methylase
VTTIRRTETSGGEAVTKGAVKNGIDTSIIWCGDNLEKLKKLPAASVDLIYIDPPFNSNRNYEVFWGETKEKRAFEDRHASTQAYIEFMRPRCVELARVLKETGSFFYHCDWHASHYVKVMLDQILGANAFRNELIWHYGGRGAKAVAYQWPRNHDVILFYGNKNEGRVFNREYLQRRFTIEEARKKGFRQDENHRWFKTSPRGDYTDDSVKKMEAEGRIHRTRDGGIRIKYFLKEIDGMVVEDALVGDTWLDIPDAMHMGNERLGYPTQKPLALLNRIITACSNKDDIVLDAFCGCGTALVSAQRLGRRWIGIDVSPTACRVMGKRLWNDSRLAEGKDFVIRDLPRSEKQLREMPPFEFENWAVIALGGIPNKVQVGDMGIDGKIYPVSVTPEKRGQAVGENTELGFMDIWFPIQVKQKDKVGRPDIDMFEAAMMRTERTKGFFVGFGFTSDAEHEIQAFFKRTGKVISPLTVKEILDEEIARKLA